MQRKASLLVLIALTLLLLLSCKTAPKDVAAPAEAETVSAASE